MHTKWGMALIFSALFLSSSLFAQQKQTDKSQKSMLSSADQSFITTAAEANLAEIETAKVVENKSTDSAVKDFANRMVTDHTQASQTLATLAEMTGTKLPAEASAGTKMSCRSSRVPYSMKPILMMNCKATSR